jgi:predicted ATPase with chaperone activity
MAEPKTIKDLLVDPQTVDDLQIPQNILVDIILRLLYNEGNLAFRRFAQVIRVPNVLVSMLEWLRQEHLVEVLSTRESSGPFGYIYKLTASGQERAKEAMERSQYVGPAPVPVNIYNQAMEMQTIGPRHVTVGQVDGILKDMVLPADFHRRIGPVVNSGNSLFLYGPSGNGKTTIARKIADLIAGTEPIWLPYALTAGGQIIQIHDRLFHNPVKNAKETPGNAVDGRWGLFQRPYVIVGGEMKMEALDLRYDAVSKIYEAPLQMKANGGMFLIDDFGRQQVSPVDLLNRWIVPLENGVDYLRLRTGQTIVVPFRELIVFSTNLDPYRLADDAFYRRIQVKVGVFSPSVDNFEQIFRIICNQLGFEFDDLSFKHLVKKWYRDLGRDFQAVHPRDILRIVHALCIYENRSLQLSTDLIDEACLSYFVEGQAAVDTD